MMSHSLRLPTVHCCPADPLRLGLAGIGALVFTSDRGGTPQPYRANRLTRQVRRLTFDGSYNASPRLFPNGKMIIYADEAGGRGTLAAVSSDGRVKQRLVAPSIDVREPAWGPLPRP